MWVGALGHERMYSIIHVEVSLIKQPLASNPH